MNTIGKNIKHYRKLLGMKQNELAELLNISEQFMGFIEQGRNKPSIELLIQISIIMKIPISYFVADRHYDNRVYDSHKFAGYIKGIQESELSRTVDLLKVLYEYYFIKIK